jgi:diguanylate cyclase (GGDEF)-like protein
VQSLLSRAAAVVAVPLCGCLVLVLLLALRWHGELDGAEKVVTRLSVEVEVGRLLNALQDERGESVAALAEVKAFQPRVPIARAHTDDAARVVNALLDKAESLAGAESFRETFARQQRLVEGLRRDADAGTLSPLEAMEEYTLAIRLVLDETERFTAVGLPTPALAELADVYRRLVLYKERAARDRGFGAALLGSSPSPELQDVYLRNLALHEAVQGELETASPGSLDHELFQRIPSPLDTEQAFQRFRKQLADPQRVLERDEVAAVTWYDLVSRQLAEMQVALEEIAEELESSTAVLEQDARRRFIVLLSVAFLSLSVIAWLSRLLSQQLVSHLEAERKQALRIQFMARHDVLTDLPNRQHFEELLEAFRLSAAAEKRLLAVHLIDLEDFARINRIWGHRTGDAVLREVARRLARVARGKIVLGRLYGDQFGLVQPISGGREEAERTAQALLATFEQPVHFEQRLVSVRARIGVTLYPPDGDTTEVLLRNADLARQHVVEGGKYTFYVAEMYETYAARRLLMDALRSSDVARDFVVYYQPKLDTSTSRIRGAEALVRWRRDGQLVAPGEFIREAERSGAIVTIGSWVFRQACEQVKTWIGQGIEAPVLAVNLSAVQLMQADLVQSLSQTLESTGIDPRCIELEITESVLTEDLKVTSERLHELRRLGLALAIDDFGTGHSSFTYLRHFPVTTIKIDQTFVRELGKSSQSEVIVDTVIQLARSLGLHVVAEGVETPEQLRMLRDKACDEVQGYLLARPLSAEAMTALLQAPHASASDQLGPSA